MLAYSRAKTIGVQKQGQDLRVVTGILEDELYAMQCEITVHWPTLTIEAVQARMKRFTTQRCPLAEQVFERAEGWQLGPDLDGKIKKDLGRSGCRHMAILMVDCCRSLARAELAREMRAALETDPDLDKSAFAQSFCQRYPQLTEYLRLQ
jgi:hypothetical protein